MSRKPAPPPPPPPKATRADDDDDGDDDSDDSDDAEEDGPTLKKQFVTFVQYQREGDPGTHILLSQSDFWMRHAGVIKGRNLTQTDTGVCYFKFKKYKLSYNEYLEFLQVLADYKNIPVQEIIEKLVSCDPPPETIMNAPKPR